MMDKMPTTSAENKITLNLFYALVIITPLFFTWTTFESFITPKQFAFKFIITLILLYAVIITAKERSFAFQNNSFYIPVILFLLWSFLSLINSINTHVSLSYYSFFFPQALLFFLTIYLIKDLSSIDKIINALIIVSTISAIIGILQFFGLNYEQGLKWKFPSKLPDKTDIYSTYGNPNFMSSFLAAVLPLILVNLWHNFNDTKKRLMYAVSALIILFCILISRTKAVWGGVIITTILLFFLAAIIHFKEKAKMGGQPFAPTLKKYLKLSGMIFLAIIGIITAISLILPAESNPIIAELSSLTLSNITFKGRELMWKTTFNMIKDHPIIGIGVNTFRLNYQNYQAEFLSRNPEFVKYLIHLGSPESPHNQYLEIAAEQGFIGLLIFLWINIVFFRKGANILRSGYQLKEKMLAAGIMSGVAGMLVHALVEFPLNLPPNAMIYWLYFGFLMIIENKQAKPIKLIKQFKPAASYLIIVISIAAALVFAYLSLRPLIASKIHRETWHLMNDKRWGDAIASAKRGINWDPLNDDLHLYLGVANYHLGNYSESMKEYSKAYELYPDYMIQFNIGLIHKKMGNLTLAEEYFKKAIFLRPNLLEAYTQLSEVYKEMGKIEESIDILNKGARYRKF